jgi:putative aldouronate transport system permease protein
MNGHKKFLTLSHIVLLIVTVFSVLPFWLLLMVSVSDEKTLVKNGATIIPSKWATTAYEYLLSKWELFGKGYLITISVTVIGVLACVTITLMFSYMLSRPGLPFAGLISFFVIFTMLFNGGLVSTYIMYTQTFHIKNTLFAYILPNLLTNAFFIIMVKNFFTSNIPIELLEAARIDGDSEFGIFRRVALPLSKPIIATLGLLVGVMYWNDWQNGLYYMDDQKMFGIQNILNSISQSTKYLMSGGGGNIAAIPTETVRMAAAVIGIIPILLIYPFFQDYFVKGITMGAVKG